MNKKGYTIIELLTVISIIALVITFSMIAFSKSLKFSRAADLKNIETDIISATEIYINNNYIKNDLYDNEEVIIYIRDLINEGLVFENIADPVTNEKISDESYVKVKIENGNILFEPNLKKEME